MIWSFYEIDIGTQSQGVDFVSIVTLWNIAHFNKELLRIGLHNWKVGLKEYFLHIRRKSF